jgi:hypothetical protein
MGFVLDTDARTDARKAEAAHLERTAAMPPPLPAKAPPAPPPPRPPTTPPPPPTSLPTPPPRAEPTPAPAPEARPLLDNRPPPAPTAKSSFLPAIAVVGLLLMITLAVAGIAYMAKSPPAPQGEQVVGANTIAPAPAPASTTAPASMPTGDASDLPVPQPIPVDDASVEPVQVTNDPVPVGPCVAECQFFRLLLQSAQTGFAQVRGESNGDGSYDTQATPGDKWLGCEITGRANSEIFHCASLPSNSAMNSSVFVETREALRAAMPGAVVQRDSPTLFTMQYGNLWAEVQVVNDENGTYTHMGAGRNRIGAPGSMPTE